MNNFKLVIAFTLAIGLTGCSTTSTERSDSTYNASIRWTSYGIPHILASDWGSAGYGLAWSVAEDAICVLADDFITVRGERSRYFGSTKENIESDAFHKGLLGRETITHYFDQGYPQSLSLVEGYVAGYNQFIADNRERLPASCRGAAWVKPIELDDVSRLAVGVGIRYGLGRFLTGIVNAAPHTPGASINTDAVIAASDSAAPVSEEAWHGSAPGSNAVGFGSALTASGRGILFGNPHYPWHGGSRFHIAHMTIPGELDVMGAGLITTPRIAMGFTRHVAWTHTVSTALRFTLFRLDLVAGDPMTYRTGAETRDIVPVPVAIEVMQGDGSIRIEDRTIYMTHLGPVLTTAATPWTAEYVYVIRDVNYENDRGGDQYHDISAARSVAEIRQALEKHQGVSFVNTVAADVEGNALYADLSSVPHVTAGQIERCATGPERVDRWRVIVLNGSDPTCDWQVDESAAAPGLMPPSQLPSLITDTYVSNSNDSHWLTNPDQPLEGYSPIIGNEKAQRSLRTRAGLVFIEEVLKRNERFTPEIVQALLYNHRHYGAELLLDDLLLVCEGEGVTLDIAAACGILTAWDRRTDIDSVGAHIYHELWVAIRGEIQNHFKVPFDINDPLHTPRGLTTEIAATRELVMNGLKTALEKLAEANVQPSAPWGEVQFVLVDGEKIGIPGGDGGAGIYSVISSGLNKETGGYNPIFHGNSYIQVVTWNERGDPQAKAILTYSQSPEPDSPHFADQTRLYSKSEWITLPFTDAEIEADTQRRLDLGAGNR